MPYCFVIQPFDGGKFDKRYDDVFAPAIRAAALEPYRVDRDPRVTVPIDEIHRGIAGASICLADITNDNPNVWFELGLAIASQRPVVIVCSNERTSRFPFDVQHLAVIKYSTESTSDFAKLTDNITQRLTAFLEKEQQLDRMTTVSLVANVEGLQPHEIAALVSVAQEADAPEDGVSAYLVRQAMENAGFTRLASGIGLRSLISKGMVECGRDTDHNDNEFFSYNLTEAGVRWLLANQDTLALRAEKTSSKRPITEDDIPF
jgi:hypothetical protein